MNVEEKCCSLPCFLSINLIYCTDKDMNLSCVGNIICVLQLGRRVCFVVASADLQLHIYSQLTLEDGFCPVAPHTNTLLSILPFFLHSSHRFLPALVKTPPPASSFSGICQPIYPSLFSSICLSSPGSVLKEPQGLAWQPGTSSQDSLGAPWGAPLGHLDTVS